MLDPFSDLLLRISLAAPAIDLGPAGDAGPNPVAGRAARHHFRKKIAVRLRFPGRKPTLVLALGLVCLGAVLEVAQSSVPARDMSLGDAIANLLGLGRGIGLRFLVAQRCHLDAK